MIFPLFLVLLVEALCVWIVFDETVSEPRIINSQADDAPRFAAVILGFIVPVLYLGYVMLILFIKFIKSLFTPSKPDSPAS